MTISQQDLIRPKLGLRLLIALAFLSAAFASTPGDVDGDGSVTMQDARLLALFLDGSISSLPNPENADFDQNGVIDLQDAFAIAQSVSGLPRIPLAEVDSGYGNRFPVGAMISAKVINRDIFQSSAAGVIEIQGAGGAYDSGQQNLTFSQDGRTLYYHWATYGLKPASDYQVTTTIKDSNGTWSSTFSVPLIATLAEPQVLTDAADLFLPYKEIGLQLSRAYRYSSNYRLYTGVMGYGWTHTFSLSLTEASDGQVAFLDSDGSTRYFLSNHDGSCRAAVGDTTQLTRDPNGTFQLRYPNGDFWRFRSNLLPDYFQDAHGSKLQLTYSATGLLNIISDSTGQSISLSYDSSGRIIQAVDSQKRSVVYSYSLAGDLASVQDTAGGITLYTYDNGHRLSRIQLPDGRTQSFTYDLAGHVSALATGTKSALVLTYDATSGIQTSTNAAGQQTTITTNAVGQPIRLANALGNSLTFAYDGNFNIARLGHEQPCLDLFI
jgi:YD repeat-containing protein